uniref:Uncharacterized protein n=1 Tax=Staphylococcus phage HS06 TaxID=3056400 RepID=A0AA49X4T0_9VIRU|nr:MAG: hypothetical protein [Staphylococcus phage HS06]DAH60903.1 MAG TPA: hypothetical protein [Caudoviricetes sp.]
MLNRLLYEWAVYKLYVRLLTNYVLLLLGYP